MAFSNLDSPTCLEVHLPGNYGHYSRVACRYWNQLLPVLLSRLHVAGTGQTRLIRGYRRPPTFNQQRHRLTHNIYLICSYNNPHVKHYGAFPIREETGIA